MAKTVKGLVIITGTPGSGKSTVANVLIKKLGMVRIDWHNLVKKNPNINLGYNRKKQSYDLDVKILAGEIRKLMKENPSTQFVFDTHISHLLPKSMVRLAIVMKCSNLKKLKKRLEDRRYNKRKVQDNMDAEIFEVCLDETAERGHKFIVIDSAKRLIQKEIATKVAKAL